MNEWVVDEDSFFSLFECYLVKHNHFKYLGGLIAYTVKSDLYDRYISKLNAEHNQNELEQLPFLSEECKLGKTKSYSLYIKIFKQLNITIHLHPNTYIYTYIYIFIYIYIYINYT
jgi:hypothetical protein